MFHSKRLLSWLASDGALVAAAFLLTLACNLTVERVPVSNGFGWDGILYGNWARNFHDEIFVKHVDTYHVQRVLPAAVVHYAMRLLRVPPTDAAILRAFGLYAVALLTLAAWAWCHIARNLQLSVAGKWLGFVGLFVNYTALKYVHYVPPGTESTAYTLGTFMLACYLYDRRIGLAIITLLGAFAWPMSVYIGGLLLMFPRGDRPPRPAPSVPRAVPFLAAAALAAIAGIGIWIVLRMPPTIETVFVDSQYIEPYRPALLLSVGIAVAYLGLGAFSLLESDRLYDVRWLFSRRHVISAALTAAGILGVQAFQGAVSQPTPYAPISILLRQTAYASVAQPGVFLVAHIAFYGPMFLLAMFLWKRTCRLLHEIGPGVTLVVFLGLLLSLNSQSRFVINIFPLLLPFVVKAADAAGWRAPQYAVMTVASLVLSKVWFTINTGPFHGRLHEFPDQGLFMTHGPWISPTMYAVQGGLFLVLAVVMYIVCVRWPGLPVRSSTS